MNTEAKLEAIERSIFRYYWEDGLVDLLLGVGLSLVGISWLSGYAALTGIIPALLVPVWILLRSKITVPRAGSVVFSRERTVQTRLKLNIASLIGFAVLTVFGAVFWYLRTMSTADDSWLNALLPSLPALLLAVVLLVVWLSFSMPRFNIHSGVVAVFGIVGLVGVEPGWQFVGAGAVIAIVGTLQFATFLREFPADNHEDGQPG